MPLTNVSWPTLYRVKHGTSSVSRYRGLGRPPAPIMDQWGVWPASPTPLTRFIELAPLRQMHARPHLEPYRFAALKRAAVGSQVSLRSIKSKVWDGSVRGKIAKGHFVQGMQQPRIFSRGWTNIAPFASTASTHCQRDASSQGRIIQETQSPIDIRNFFY